MRVIFATLFACLSLEVSVSAASEKKPSAHNEGIPFILDSNRILLDVVFTTPDGHARSALAWFNMGMSTPVLTKPLYRELGVDRGAPLRLAIGEWRLEARADQIVDGDGGVGVPSFTHLFAPRRVEAMLPARMLTNYVLRIDYGRRRMALNAAGGRRPEGLPVPILLNEDSGIVAVEAEVDNDSRALAIDAGSGYSWMRGDVARDLLARHPEWRRVHGAIGAANANMVDFAFEKEGDVLRIPNVRIGDLQFRQVGFLGTAPIFGSFAEALLGDLFWDNWRKAAPVAVVGWLGGNALRDYQLTIDYPNRMSYWRRERAPDLTELDQPPITLVRQGERYLIGGVAQTRTKPQALLDVEIGDELLAIDGLAARGASKDDVLAALHGAPGARKRLTLDRRGARIEADVAVESFE
ncbi:peptide-binding protein [Methylocystis sp. SC2]|uniref:peptide-binding protein n=1 Tax=Methylocystis sp. (strain SC2) TaxID=187303 RepID=UPI00027AEC38|nr:peptide-binding protein [Methylocystis sp. SC2]CCJ05713.1 PDZ/DHR/GLGF domain protein [Methylocystis sp. SC2]